MERSDIKGIKGDSPCKMQIGDSKFGILPYNPSCGETVKFNYDCDGDDGIKFNYGRGWIVAG